MVVERSPDHVAAQIVAERSHKKWQELSTMFLPVTPEGSLWRYSRPTGPKDPTQGWKLHISGTVLNAINVFEKVAPFLQGRGVLFKAPVSLLELKRLNCGLFYGYSQVGKFITVYPQTDREAVSLANSLHRLTKGMKAPAVPFDQEFRTEGCVYYRYGSFAHLEMVNADGLKLPAIRDLDGNLAPDERYSNSAKPEWVNDPFPSYKTARPVEIKSPLQETYQSFAALTQRGKGGVYRAVDLSGQLPRFCILKEGRRNGEIDWDGRDGYWRIGHERDVLRSLRSADVPVPEIYASFPVENNFYLVIEAIQGESLHTALQKRKRRISIRQALRVSAELAQLIQRIHNAGWAWRDFKPSNIIVTKQGFRPIDFEGACPVDQQDPVPWGDSSF